MFSTDFIAATQDYTTYTHHVPAPYLRKSFELCDEVVSADITICGLGFYRLFINGQEITKGLLAPYVCNPDDFLYYDHYEIGEYLQPGKNAIGILLGNGMLNCPGGMTWSFDKAVYRSAPKVALSLEIAYTNGKTQRIKADSSFKTHPSAILFDDYRCGEIYDARREITGWNLPDFDDSQWEDALPAVTPKGEPTLCTAECIVKRKELRPISIKKAKIGDIYGPKAAHDRESVPLEEEDREGYLYDFGENMAGLVRLRINGQPGQRISIQTGELLDEEGNLNLIAMWAQPVGINHRMVYTCAGGEASYAASFTYFGMRYCLVSGITPEQATEDLLTFEVMSSDLKDMGWFSCSDEILNRLQQAAYNADVSNFYYFPTDCPHREKNGWTGDAAISAEQLLLWLTPENSFRVWLDNIRKAQKGSGELPGIVPTSGWGYSVPKGICYNGPAWDRVIVDLPYFVWKYRGDDALIRENAAAIRKYLVYLSGKRDDRGLLELGLGDYVPTLYRQQRVPLVVVSTTVAMGICTRCAKMLAAIGDREGSTFAQSLFADLRKAARAELLEEDGITVLGQTQSGQCMGIAYGLFEPEEIKAAVDVLLERIHFSEDHLDTGILGQQVMFDVLSHNGYADLAYHMIVRPDYPSYGHWILHENCTSLFESFRHPDRNRIDPQSKNHHWQGNMTAWYFKSIAGIHINPEDRDVNEILIAPHFLQAMQYAEAWHQHPAGRLAARWERKEDQVILTLQIPEMCHGWLRLPEGWQTENAEFRIPLTSGSLQIRAIQCGCASIH